MFKQSEGNIMKSNVLKQYINEDGVKVTVYKPAKPRKNEKTWGAEKYSIANIGRLNMITGRMGIRSSVDNLKDVA
jgi:hypothetical protein